MTCNVFIQPPMTQREAIDIISPGESHDWPGVSADELPRGMGQAQLEKWIAERRQRLEEARNSTENIAPTGQVFLCGDLVLPVCVCGVGAEYLCDYPVGNGQTCDIDLCVRCRRSISEDRDLCAIHHAEFTRKSGVEQVNPWPPKRGR